MRRPKQFFDGYHKWNLDRPLKVEHYLDIFLNKNQEFEFGDFVRSLCEVEIYLNILPHTGFIGGSDGKIDSETYSVF